MNHNLVVPQIAVGTNYTTNLVLLNLGDARSMGWLASQDLRTTGKVHFFRQDGSRLPVAVNGSSSISEFAFSLDPSETASYELTYSGPDTSGWALIAIDDARDNNDWGMMDDIGMDRGHRVMATVFYTYRESGQTISRVGVVPSVYEMQRFFRSVLPAQSQAELATGVAIVNTNAATVTVDLELKDSKGQVVASRRLLLRPGNQTARFIHELFDTTLPAQFHGLLEVSSAAEGVVTMGLFVSNGILTSVPVLHYGRMTARGMMQ